MADRHILLTVDNLVEDYDKVHKLRDFAEGIGCAFSVFDRSAKHVVHFSEPRWHRHDDDIPNWYVCQICDQATFCDDADPVELWCDHCGPHGQLRRARQCRDSGVARLIVVLADRVKA